MARERVQRDVAALFNEVQRNAAATERCAKHVWRLAAQHPAETEEALGRCVELVLTAGQKTPPVERCVRHLGAIAALAPPTDAGEQFLESLMRTLSGHLGAADKGVRFRAAQCLACVLQAMLQGACIDEGLAQELAERLRERLRDKATDVRACAARALGRLPACDEAGSYADDPATSALTERLAWEKNKDVRVAILQALPLADDTLPVIMERLRDVAPGVRKAVVAQLTSLPPSVLSIKQRARLLGVGLRDRDPQVKAAAEAGLARWLSEECGGEALALLALLDVETYAEEATLAMESLLAAGALDPGAMAAAAAARGGGLRGAAAAAAAAAAGVAGEGGELPPAAFVKPAEALMWRCVCEWLLRDATSEGLAAAATTGAAAAVRAAAASRRHEVLEDILPDSAAATVSLLLAHAASGPRARFAATQLAAVAATCVDWADASSRGAAAQALQAIISLDPRHDDEDDGPASRGPAGDEDGAEGIPLFGNGGDGAFEGAAARLAAAVHAGGPSEFAGAMLDALAALAAKSGLLPMARDPDGEGEGPGEGSAAAGGGAAAEPCQWLQLLQYASLALRHVPTRRPPAAATGAAARAAWDVVGAGMSLQDVWEVLLLPGVAHDAPAVRALALEGVSLYCLARPAPAALPAAALLLRRVLLAGGERDEVKAAAARGLADLFLSLGPVAVDSLLAAAAAEEEARGGGEGDRGGAGEDGGAAPWRPSDGRGVAQLLTAAVTGAIRGEDLAAADKPRRGRSSAASAADGGLPDEASCGALLDAGAEALAKLLIHQGAWLRAAADTGKRGGASPSGEDAEPAAPSASPEALRRALSALLLLNFHPATERALRLRQCLSVFFEAFAASAAEHRRALAVAALPAAREAHMLAAAGGRVAAARLPAPMLLRFVSQLLLQGAPGAGNNDKDDADEDDRGDDGGAKRRRQSQKKGQQQRDAQRGAADADADDDWGAAAFAQQLLTEAECVWRVLLARGVQPSRNRPYASALVEAAQSLPLRQGCRGLGVLLSLAQRLSEQCAPDAALSKHLAALLGRLEALEAASAPALDEDELEEVIGKLRGVCLAMEPALGGGGGAAAAAPSRQSAAAAAPAAAGGDGAGRGAAGKPPARSARGKGRRPASSASSGEGEWDDGDDSDDVGRGQDVGLAKGDDAGRTKAPADRAGAQRGSIKGGARRVAAAGSGAAGRRPQQQLERAGDRSGSDDSSDANEDAIIISSSDDESGLCSAEQREPGTSPVGRRSSGHQRQPLRASNSGGGGTGPRPGSMVGALKKGLSLGGGARRVVAAAALDSGDE